MNCKPVEGEPYKWATESQIPFFTKNDPKYLYYSRNIPVWATIYDIAATDFR